MLRRYEHSATVSVGARLIAFLWDYAIIFGYLLLLSGASWLLRPLLTPLFTAGPLSAEITGFLLITLPVYLYFGVCEGSKSQATWGKQKMGIVVTDVHGRPIGLGRSLLRSAIKFIPWELAHFTVWHTVLPSGFTERFLYSLFAVVYGLVLLYLISPLLNKNKQTVYDMIAGTVVRRREPGMG